MIRTWLSQWRWWLGPLVLFVVAMWLASVARDGHNVACAGLAGVLLATVFWRGYAQISQYLVDYYRGELERLEQILDECDCGEEDEDE